MTGTEPLIQTLKKLRLSGILDTLDLRTRQALDDGLSHSEFLFRLLSDEVERRDSRQLDQRLRRANFESHKTLEDFDWRFNPGRPAGAGRDSCRHRAGLGRRSSRPRR